MIISGYKYAIDTNILVYSLSNENDISEQAISLITPMACVSNFAIQEFLFQLKHKFKFNKVHSMKIAIDLLSILNLNRMDKDNYRYANFLMRRHQFSLEDAMVVSDAILNNCSTLYSRDMQDGQVVDKKLKIINPFK